MLDFLLGLRNLLTFTFDRFTVLGHALRLTGIIALPLITCDQFISRYINFLTVNFNGVVVSGGVFTIVIVIIVNDFVFILGVRVYRFNGCIVLGVVWFSVG